MAGKYTGCTTKEKECRARVQPQLFNDRHFHKAQQGAVTHPVSLKTLTLDIFPPLHLKRDHVISHDHGNKHKLDCSVCFFKIKIVSITPNQIPNHFFLK